MQEKIEAFLTFFELELNDLRQDIEILTVQYKIDYDHELVSNCMFYKNLERMNDELFGIDSFLDEVKGITPSDFDEIGDIVSHLKQRLLKRCRDKGIASFAYLLAERKMNKIRSYIEMEKQVPTL